MNLIYMRKPVETEEPWSLSQPWSPHLVEGVNFKEDVQDYPRQPVLGWQDTDNQACWDQTTPRVPIRRPFVRVWLPVDSKYKHSSQPSQKPHCQPGLWGPWACREPWKWDAPGAFHQNITLIAPSLTFLSQRTDFICKLISMWKNVMCGRMQKGDKVQLLQQGVRKLSSQICHHQSVSLGPQVTKFSF